MFLSDSDQQPSININFDQLIMSYAQKDFSVVSKDFLTILDFFNKQVLIEKSPKLSTLLNKFLHFLLMMFSQEEFQIPEEDAHRFLVFNPVIANLARISDLRTTDTAIAALLKQDNNFLKILVLYNSYCVIQVDIQELFQANASFASYWLYWYLQSPLLVNKTAYNNLVAMLEKSNTENNIKYINEEFIHPHFNTTYINYQNDKIFKNKINQWFKEKEQFPLASLKNIAQKRIAIASAVWSKGTAVYKTLFNSVSSLFDESIELTLIKITVEGLNLGSDTTGFKDVIEITINPQTNEMDLTPLIEKNFHIIFYPDVGMLAGSIYLANKRLAPIQICSYGHPVSTYGSEIDYWFGGQDLEHPTKVKENYSEHMVSLPGLGIQSIYPKYTRKYPPKNSNIFIINCAWTGMKVNNPLISSLRRILDKVSKPVLFRFFPSLPVQRYNGFLAWRMDVEEILGAEHVEVFPHLNDYDFYMSKLEEADMGMDCYPFGGFNTVIDQLYLKKPVVVLEGDRAYNRFASHTLRFLELNELITHSWEEYENVALNLINNDNYRQSIAKKITDENFDTMMRNSTDPSAFRRAIDYLIEKHEILQKDSSREPIIIN